MSAPIASIQCLPRLASRPLIGRRVKGCCGLERIAGNGLWTIIVVLAEDERERTVKRAKDDRRAAAELASCFSASRSSTTRSAGGRYLLAEGRPVRNATDEMNVLYSISRLR
jgi:hypothetical protein